MVVTASFRLLYVFVVIHHGSRRLLHFDVTANPTAAWTLQQLRETIGFEDAYRYLIHDPPALSGVTYCCGKVKWCRAVGYFHSHLTIQDVFHGQTCQTRPTHLIGTFTAMLPSLAVGR